MLHSGFGTTRSPGAQKVDGPSKNRERSKRIIGIARSMCASTVGASELLK